MPVKFTTPPGESAALNHFLETPMRGKDNMRTAAEVLIDQLRISRATWPTNMTSGVESWRAMWILATRWWSPVRG